MYDRVMIKFKEGDFEYEEKKEVLTEGRCKGIFPISLVDTGSEIKGYYSTSGYIRLSCCKNLSAEKVLTIVEKAVSAIEECGQYLIFPEEFIMNLDTVYIKEDFEEAKFTYIPDKSKTGGLTKIVGFIHDLKKIATDNGKLYLDMLKDLFATERVSFVRIQAFIIQLKREVKLCNIC